jgi:DNA-directed RNA polymerase specialized sigma24 family protein
MNKPEPTDPGTRGWPQSREDVAALVDAYADRLVCYAFRQVGNVQDAEDVVQDVFVRAFAFPPKRRQRAVAAFVSGGLPRLSPSPRRC